MEEEDLTCPVCLEEFEDPRVLKCCHTLCKRCIDALFQKNRKLECPMCLFQTPIPPSDNASSTNTTSDPMGFLPRNLVIEEKRQQYHLKKDSKQQPASFRCGKCAEEEVEDQCEVVGFCKECSVFLCEDHMHTHSRAKTTKGHSIISMEEVHNIPNIQSEFKKCQQPVATCGVHSGKPLDIFCSACCRSVCTQCVLIGSHQTHERKDIKLAFEEFKSLTIPTMEELKKYESELMKELEIVRSAYEAVVKRGASLKKEISTTIKKAIKRLEAREAQLHSEVEKICVVKQKALAQRRASLMQLLPQIRGGLTHASKAMADGNVDDVVSMKRMIEGTLGELKSGQFKRLHDADALIFFVVDVNGVNKLIEMLGTVTTTPPLKWQCSTLPQQILKDHEFQFTLTSRLEQGGGNNNNPIRIEGECPLVNIIKKDSNEIQSARVQDNRNGTFSVTCVPSFVGDAQVCMTVHGRHVANSPIPIKVIDPSLPWHSPMLFAVGGSGKGSLNVVERYDPRSDKWITMAPMPTPRHCLGVCGMDGQLFAVGGQGSGGYFNVAERYDPQSNKWIAAAPMSTPRRYLGVCGMDGQLFAVGGYNGGILNAVERYDPQSNKWIKMAPIPTPRYGLGVCAL